MKEVMASDLIVQHKTPLRSATKWRNCKNISKINPTKEMQDKINKLRELQELPQIQFDDYINTTN